MKITKHGDNLIQLTRFGLMNCFLVREDDGFTLVDTGMSGSADGIIKAAEQLGAPIRRIALTHAHIDHVGSLDALHQRLPDAEVSIGERESRLLKGDKTLEANEQHSPLRGSYLVCTTMPDQLLRPGDKVGSLEVIATPGHTPGHIAFFDARDRSLIAGDSFSTAGGISTAGTLRWLFPLPAMATWSRKDGLRSAEVMRAMQPSRLAVGHGQTLSDPGAAMQKAIDEAKRKLEGK